MITALSFFLSSYIFARGLEMFPTSPTVFHHYAGNTIIKTNQISLSPVSIHLPNQLFIFIPYGLDHLCEKPDYNHSWDQADQYYQQVCTCNYRYIHPFSTFFLSQHTYIMVFVIVYLNSFYLLTPPFLRLSLSPRRLIRRRARGIHTLDIWMNSSFELYIQSILKKLTCSSFHPVYPIYSITTATTAIPGISFSFSTNIPIS